MSDMHIARQFHDQIRRGKDPEGRDITKGKYTERSATCPKHHAQSRQFEGVNVNGWLFRCKGAKDEPGSMHVFVAKPPEAKP